MAKTSKQPSFKPKKPADMYDDKIIIKGSFEELAKAMVVLKHPIKKKSYLK
jgi:hypothetical protein